MKKKDTHDYQGSARPGSIAEELELNREMYWYPLTTSRLEDVFDYHYLMQ